MNSKQLNEVVRFLAANGIKIENTGSFRQAVIGLCVRTLVDAGLTVKEALDAVIGEGTYQKIADSVWEAANA